MSCFCCNCFSSSKRHNQLSLEPEEEPNAFDLTWRNYLLPTSSCCIPNIFKRNQHIRLDDDDDIIDDELFISPYDQQPRFFDNSNNNNRYHGRAVRGYLDDPRDWEFDSMLAEGGEFPPAGFVTRNPFGRKNSSKKKRKHRKHNQHNNYPRVIQQNDDDQEIFSEEIQDAEFLGDDQIDHLAYEHSKNMDPYGEEGYIDSTYGRPLSQEMQPPSTQKEFYAPRTMPSYYFVDQDDNEGCYVNQHDYNKGNTVVKEDEYYQQQQEQQEQQERREHQQQNEASSSTAPVVTTVAEQAQDLLSERLDDLTDKLIYIRKNMMDMNNKKEQEPDNTTLRTINKSNDNYDDHNDDQNVNDSIKKGPDSDKTGSDMDSIASEALNEYEQPVDDDDEHERRRRSAASQYKFPFSGGDSPPFGSDHHPFSYFTEHNNNNNNNNNNKYKHKHKHTASSSSLSSSHSRRHSALVNDDNNTPGLTIRGVLDFGKKWLGS